MKILRAAFVLLALTATTATAQPAANTATSVRDELLMHFDMSMRKFIALAEAMPADRFRWKPEKDAMEVGQVYAHVANYNFGYPSQNMGIAMPAGINRDTIEAMRDKAQIVALLKSSADYVKKNIASMPSTQLERGTRLYGRDVQNWAVLVQLVDGRVKAPAA